MMKFGFRAGLVLTSVLAFSAWGGQQNQNPGTEVSHGANQVANGTSRGAKTFGKSLYHGTGKIFKGIGHEFKRVF